MIHYGFPLSVDSIQPAIVLDVVQGLDDVLVVFR